MGYSGISYLEVNGEVGKCTVGLGHTLWLDIGDARPQSDWGTTRPPHEVP